MKVVELLSFDTLQAAKAAAQAGQPFRLLFISPSEPSHSETRTTSHEGDPEVALLSTSPRQPDSEDSLSSRLRLRLKRPVLDLTAAQTSRHVPTDRRTTTGSSPAVTTRARARAMSAGGDPPGTSGRTVALPADALWLAEAIKSSPELKSLLLLVIVSEGGEKLEAGLKARGVAGTVTLPLRQQSVQAVIREALGMGANQRADSAGRGKAQMEKWLRGKKVMVVDDTQINRRVAGAMLARYGCSVLTLASGQEAIEYLEKMWRDGEGDPIDIIFMDVQMPLMSGYEATQMIRALERQYCKCQTEPRPSGVRRRRLSTPGGEIEEITPGGLGAAGCSGSCQYGRLPVCAVTADVMKGTRERCMEAGMTDYLPKPLDQKHLRATLAKVFGLPEDTEIETAPK